MAITTKWMSLLPDNIMEVPLVVTVTLTTTTGFKPKTITSEKESTLAKRESQIYTRFVCIHDCMYVANLENIAVTEAH